MPRRILIVDDDNALMFSLSDYLTFRGCQVDGAEGLDDALALAPDESSISDETGHPLDVDHVLARHLPMAQLARVLCNALAA